jgi:hypothetical protein
MITTTVLVARHGRPADATAFVGLNTTPASRPVTGFAIG